jgi:hypothetical protein
MRTRAYNRRIDELERRDGFLFASLGLALTLGRFDGLLERYAPETPTPAKAAARSNAGRSIDDPAASELAMVVLGLIAVRKTCGRLLSGLAAAEAVPSSGEPPGTTRAKTDLRGTLR